MRTITLNADDMGCEHGIDSRVTCGTCQRNWCDICVPTPAARCPYEYEHVVEVEPPVLKLPHGGCNHRECRECFPDEKVRNRLEQEEIERAIRFLTDYGFTVTKVDENNE